jgi:hypothetical protein
MMMKGSSLIHSPAVKIRFSALQEMTVLTLWLGTWYSSVEGMWLITASGDHSPCQCACKKSV